jgi:hypothetical protein
MGERGGQRSRSEKEVSGNYSKEGHTILERAIGFLAPPPPPLSPHRTLHNVRAGRGAVIAGSSATQKEDETQKENEKSRSRLVLDTFVPIDH